MKQQYDRELPLLLDSLPRVVILIGFGVLLKSDSSVPLKSSAGQPHKLAKHDDIYFILR